jgi:ATP-dependent DNA helicase 2 subunit 2
VQREVFYTDADDPDKKELKGEDVIKAYFYGKQLVPIEKINEEVLKFTDDRCLKMLGFTDGDKVPRHHYMAGCDIVVPVESAKNRKAFSSLILAMIDMDKVMIAKWVSRKNCTPKLVCLYPYHTPKFECLYMNVLPTVEDIRDYQFGSLTVSTDVQQQAMDEFVDALDIDEIEEEEGVQNEINVYNPTLQYFNQCVIHRIYNGEEAPLPELHETIDAQARPEGDNLQRAQEQIEELESAFDLIEESKEDIQNRGRNRRIRLGDIILTSRDRIEEEEKEIKQEVQPSEQVPEMTAEDKQRKFDFNNEEKVDKISSMNPVRDFEKIINDREVDRVNDALTQMRDIILEFIRESIQGDVYEKALDCLKAMRKACKDNDEAEKFNEFLKELKQRFSTGIHKAFYETVRNSGTGLITKDESFSSKITKEEADKFFGFDEQQLVEEVEEAPENEKNGKQDDMFDEIE